MNKLNYDCQVLILKLLDFKDELSLYGAYSVETTSYVTENLRIKWQNQRKFELNCEEFELFQKTPEILRDFLSIIGQTVKELQLNDVTLDRLEPWTNYNFPEIKSLEYTVAKHTEFDTVIGKLTQIFPELRTVKPSGTFDLIHLANWKKLRKLILMSCYTASKTPESVKGLEHLQQLEELELRGKKLNDEHFRMFCLLPNLRRLVVKDKRDYLEWIGESRAEDVEKIVLHSCTKKMMKSLWNFKNLLDLTLVHTVDLDVKDVHELVVHLPKLERMDVVGYLQFMPPEVITETLALCPSLRLLSVTLPALTMIDYVPHFRNAEQLTERFTMVNKELYAVYSAKFQFYPPKST